jgi:hypothetical protein
MNAGFVRDEVVRVSAMIALARQMIEAGVPVDLTPVGYGIDTLCRAVGRLPESEAGRLRDDLAQLNAKLERLGNDLTAQYAAAMRPGPTLAAPSAQS